MSKVCADCIGEEFLHEKIMQDGVVGHCDYCQSKGNRLGINRLEFEQLKKPAVMRACGLSGMLLGIELVEAAGIEPASANPLPSVLHVYPRQFI